MTTFAPSLNGPINDMALVGGRLFVAGTFTAVKSVTHAGLVSVNPATGALDPYLTVNLTGHHNYGRVAGAANQRVASRLLLRGVPRSVLEQSPPETRSTPRGRPDAPGLPYRPPSLARLDRKLRRGRPRLRLLALIASDGAAGPAFAGSL